MPAGSLSFDHPFDDMTPMMSIKFNSFADISGLARNLCQPLPGGGRERYANPLTGSGSPI
jgi:hypothetical protein